MSREPILNSFLIMIIPDESICNIYLLVCHSNLMIPFAMYFRMCSWWARTNETFSWLSEKIHLWFLQKQILPNLEQKHAEYFHSLTFLIEENIPQTKLFFFSGINNSAK